MLGAAPTGGNRDGPTVPEQLVRDTLAGMTTEEIASVVGASLPEVTE